MGRLPSGAWSCEAGICEDDDELRGVVRRALEREGFAVVAVATGADAVRAFARRRFDVLVLDVGLPDADGRDVCQALRARGVATPVLFLTARDALPDRLSGFHAGGDDYLTKPFALAELLVRVQALVRRAAAADPQPRATATAGAAPRSLRPRGPARGRADPADADGVPAARRAGRAAGRGRPARDAGQRRVAGGRDRPRQHARRVPRAAAAQAARRGGRQAIHTRRGLGYELR